jgi:hypothetical protein
MQALEGVVLPMTKLPYCPLRSPRGCPSKIAQRLPELDQHISAKVRSHATHLDLSLVLFDVLLEQLSRLDVRGTAL